MLKFSDISTEYYSQYSKYSLDFDKIHSVIIPLDFTHTHTHTQFNYFDTTPLALSSSCFFEFHIYQNRARNSYYAGIWMKEQRAV